MSIDRLPAIAADAPAAAAPAPAASSASGGGASFGTFLENAAAPGQPSPAPAASVPSASAPSGPAAGASAGKTPSGDGKPKTATQQGDRTDGAVAASGDASTPIVLAPLVMPLVPLAGTPAIVSAGLAAAAIATAS